MRRRIVFFVLVVATVVSAQTLRLEEPRTKNYVSYLAEPAQVQAGKPAEVELYFRVEDAIHINSHTPLDPYLIPVTLTFEPAQGVKLGRIDFPPATKYAFSFAPREKLSVYTGDFVVKARVTAAHAGSYTVNGMLRYQACDNAQCYPPKTLPVTVILNAK